MTFISFIKKLYKLRYKTIFPETQHRIAEHSFTSHGIFLKNWITDGKFSYQKKLRVSYTRIQKFTDLSWKSHRIERKTTCDKTEYRHSIELTI